MTYVRPAFAENSTLPSVEPIAKRTADPKIAFLTVVFLVVWQIAPFLIAGTGIPVSLAQRDIETEPDPVRMRREQ